MVNISASACASAIPLRTGWDGSADQRLIADFCRLRRAALRAGEKAGVAGTKIQAQWADQQNKMCLVRLEIGFLTPRHS